MYEVFFYNIHNIIISLHLKRVQQTSIDVCNVFTINVLIDVLYCITDVLHTHSYYSKQNYLAAYHQNYLF